MVTPQKKPLENTQKTFGSSLMNALVGLKSPQA